MKKRVYFFRYVFIFISLLLLSTGCTNKNNNSMTCTRIMNQNNIKTNLKYYVEYNDGYVSKVKSVETVESDNSNILNTYKSQIESLYSPYKDIDYYKYNVEIKDNKLISTVNINYEKVDTDKLIEIDSSNGQLIKNGKIKVDDIKNVYEKLGATCK